MTLKNKPRLQLALYARPKHPDAPHYALFISPKRLPSPKKHRPAVVIKHHVKNTFQTTTDRSGNPELSQPWRYERFVISDLATEPYLLVVVTVAKITTSSEAIEEVFHGVPIYQVDDVDEAMAKEVNCVSWVREAWREYQRLRLISTKEDMDDGWDHVEKRALDLFQAKKQEGWWLKRETGVPVLDLTTGKESVIPLSS